MGKEKLTKVQNDTINEILDNLNKYHKCLVVRPTGFGKTKMSIDIMKNFNTVIFLYPYRNIENEIYKYDLDENINLYLYTYAYLRNTYKKINVFNSLFEDCDNNNTLFIMDEAHFIGAEMTSITIKYLMDELCPHANYLGLTATPNRTDKLEIKWHFFDGHITSEYNISDAINDGIFKSSWYVYTPMNTESLLNDYYEKINSMEISSNKKAQLKNQVHRILNPQKSNIKNLDSIIKNNLDKFENSKGYYKFLLYFTTFKDIHNKKKEIINAFKKAFPGYNINPIIVSSENLQYKENLNKIPELKVIKNTIDLIFNVNMLSFGYHDTNITGIMMFRPTVSDIVYTQEIGRIFSAYQKYKGIIFDFVENLDRFPTTFFNSLYSVNSGKSDDEDNLNTLFNNSGLQLDDKTKDLLEIDRLIQNCVNEEFEEEVIRAYMNDLVDMEYCICKLHLHDKNDFDKILRRYKNNGSM